MPDLDTAFTAVVWAAVAILTGVVVVDLGRGWWEERQHARRMAAPRFTRGANIAPTTPVETPRELKIPIEARTEPVSEETHRDIEAGREVLAAFGATYEEVMANLDLALAALTCDYLGHDFPEVSQRALCDPEPTTTRGACTRCGTPPGQADPNLWEGDNA